LKALDGVQNKNPSDIDDQRIKKLRAMKARKSVRQEQAKDFFTTEELN
jgi:hypothetical protein